MRLVLLALVAGALAGAVAVYVRENHLGNAAQPQIAAASANDAACTAKADEARKIGASATGQVAALLPADPPQSLKDLAFEGPDGQPMPEEFPMPDDVSMQRIDAVTGHRAGSGETKEDLIADGLEPQLARNELSDWERRELDNALRQVDRGASWAGDAQGSILRYASVTGVREQRIEPVRSNDDDDSDSSNGSDSGSDTGSDGNTGDGGSDGDNGGDENVVPIEPIDPDD